MTQLLDILGLNLIIAQLVPYGAINIHRAWTCIVVVIIRSSREVMNLKPGDVLGLSFK